MGYLPRVIPDTFSAATRLTCVQPIQEYARPTSDIWYHLVPKGSDVSNGILSPYYMDRNHNGKMLSNSLSKYRERMVGGWNIYPGKNADDLTNRELLDGLVKFRGKNGDHMIYLFRYPPTENLGPNMAEVLGGKDVYEVNLSKIPDIIEIDYGHEGSNTDNKKLTANYYHNITPEQYFKEYDDNTDGLLFANINHISIATKSGRIPPEAIRKIETLQEATKFRPSLGDFSSPIYSGKSRWVSDDEKESKEPDDPLVLFGISSPSSPEELFFGSDDFDFSPPEFLSVDSFEVPNMLVETAMKAKERNALDDSEFGLPRLRKYPLNDRKHVAQAIRMFGHVKIEADRKTLAAAIVKKYDQFKMTTKVGKNNPLYKYVPDRMKLKSVNEGAEVTVYGFEKPQDQRTTREVVMEHLRMNSSLYNNLFFNNDYAAAVKRMYLHHRPYLEYFYPSFKVHNFLARTKTSIGGIYTAIKEEGAEYIASILDNPEEFQSFCEIRFSPIANWYKTENIDAVHIRWCIELYSLIQKILQCNYEITDKEQKLMLEWLGNVEYHRDCMREAVEYSDEYFMHCQYLHDMFWDPLDNPEDSTTCGANIVSFIMAIHPDSTGSVNESGELIKKQDILTYMTKELEFDDTIYLLPSKSRYPVLDVATVRLAMDAIRHVDEDDIEEYVTNLNQKYKELNCKFQISADHPYAKYADETMKCISCVLAESDGNTQDDTLPKAYRFAESIYYHR